MRLSLLYLLFLTLTGLAQTANPELDALKTQYGNSVTALHKARDERAAPLTKSYLANLDRLEKQTPSLATAIKSEMDRVTAGQPMTEDLRRTLPAALAQPYALYASDLQRAAAPYDQQEQKLTRQYLGSLDALQRKLITQNQMAQAAQVRAEHDSSAAALPKDLVASGGKIPAATTIASGAAHTAGTLDPALVQKIAAAVAAKAYVRTNSTKSPPAPQTGEEVPEAGALLVGFELFEVGETKWIRSLRPYYLSGQGLVPGKDRGQMEKVTTKVLARPGFAVAGIVTMEGVVGFQVVFMKIDPASGKFLSDSANTYKSQWYGKKGRGQQQVIGGDGNLVIGVYGKTGANCDELGFVTLK